MPWQQTPYTLPLVLAVAFLLGFAGYLWWLGRGRSSFGTTIGGLLMVVGAEWVLAYTLKLSSTTVESKFFWMKFEFLAVVALPVVWLAYVLWYTGRKEWLDRRLFGALAGIGAVILALVVTNERHHLVYRRIALDSAGSFVVFDPTYGPAFWLYMAFAYSLLVLSIGLLASAFVHTRGIFRWQIAVLLLFSTVPGIAGVLYTTGHNPVPGLNIAALSTVVTAVAGAVSVARFNWMDVTPIARDNVFEAVNDAVIVVDSESRIVDLNPPAERLLAGERADIVTSRVADYLPEIEPLLEPATAADTQELTIETGTDSRVFEVTVSVVTGGPARQTGWTVLLHDITARKRITDELRTRTAKIERLHTIARELLAVHTVDDVSRIVVDGLADTLDADVCHLAETSDGRFAVQASSTEPDTDDRFGPTAPLHADLERICSGNRITVVDDLADTRGAAQSHSPASNVIADGPEDTGTADRGTDDREYRSLLCAPVEDAGVLVVAAPEPNAFDETDEELVDLLVSHTESVLDRIETEDDLRAERDRLDEFASIVSHDLRNPLNVASGRLEMARAECDSDHLASVASAHDRMEALIEDLLTLAREGESVEATEPVDLRTIAERAWSNVETADATLVTETDRTVRADPGRLAQLLENLFRNAVEHGGESVTVCVGALGTGFYVEDDGPGIPEDERERVFEAGYSSTTDGTGFGLQIVERIAEAHGWTVRVTDGETGGARFEITNVDRH